MNVFFVSVAAEDELELGGGHEFADDVKDVVTNDAFRGGEVTNAHFDDPALDVGDFTPLPLLDIGLHLDVLGLPVVALHVLVEVVSPLVFQGEDIEEHGVATVDDRLGGDGGVGFVFIEDKSAVANGDGSGVGHGCCLVFREFQAVYFANLDYQAKARVEQ